MSQCTATGTCEANKPAIEAAGEALRSDGYAVLSGSIDDDTRELLLNDTSAWLSQLRAVAQRWPDSRVANSNAAVCFADMTQREAGKLEIALPRLREPQLRERLAGPWIAAVEHALGGTAELRHASVITSSAHGPTGEAAVDQAWHSDGSWLASAADGSCRNCVDLPAGRAYAVVVYLPLEDVADGGGRVEYLPRTHTDRSLSNRLLEAGPPAGVAVERPRMEAGSALLYEFRTWHRGLARRAPDGDRPVLKLDYFGPGVGPDEDNAWCDYRGSALDLQTPCFMYLDAHAAHPAACSELAATGRCTTDAAIEQTCRRACCMRWWHGLPPEEQHRRRTEAQNTNPSAQDT